MEYNERRGHVLGGAAAVGRSPASRLAGRKRRRGWEWPGPPNRRLPNAMVLDVIPEYEHEDMEVETVLPLSEGEDTQMNVHTVVFGLGSGGEVQAG